MTTSAYLSEFWYCVACVDQKLRCTATLPGVPCDYCTKSGIGCDRKLAWQPPPPLHVQQAILSGAYTSNLTPAPTPPPTQRGLVGWPGAPQVPAYPPWPPPWPGYGAPSPYGPYPPPPPAYPSSYPNQAYGYGPPMGSFPPPQLGGPAGPAFPPPAFPPWSLPTPALSTPETSSGIGLSISLLENCVRGSIAHEAEVAGQKSAGPSPQEHDGERVEGDHGKDAAVGAVGGVGLGVNTRPEEMSSSRRVEAGSQHGSDTPRSDRTSEAADSAVSLPLNVTPPTSTSGGSRAPQKASFPEDERNAKRKRPASMQPMEASDSAKTAKKRHKAVKSGVDPDAEWLPPSESCDD